MFEEHRFSAFHSRRPFFALLVATELCISLVRFCPAATQSDTHSRADANSSAHERTLAAEYNWSANPVTDLSIPGPHTIDLPSCPPGVRASEPWFYVYIAGIGTPEAVKVTGGTCKGDGAAGTLQFTTINAHGTGYSVGSASDGLQEASIAERWTPAGGQPQTGVVLATSGEFDIHARVSFRTSFQIIDFSGSVFNCYMNDTCIFVGDPMDSNAVGSITLINPGGRPMVAAGTKPMIETNGNYTCIFNVVARRSPTGASFGTYVQVDDDQAFLLDGLNSGEEGVRCDAEFCGAYVTAPGPFNRWSAVGWLKHMQISNHCNGNGVDWQSGNTLRIEDSVIQGFSQFGIRTGTPRGGYGPTIIANVYQEVGNCFNPQYSGKDVASRQAIAGLINLGSALTIEGNMYPVGQVPRFANNGSLEVHYWVVVKDSKMGSSVPLHIGYAKTGRDGKINVSWPRVPGTNVITYDLLRNTGSGYPFTTPFGTDAYAVATNIPQCSDTVCTYEDPNAALRSYEVASPTYFPFLKFWPGGIILSPNADTQNSSGPTKLYVESTRFVTGTSPLVNAFGGSVPTVLAKECAAVSVPYTWVSCLAGDSVGNSAIPSATLLQYGYASGGDPSNRKGRLIFGRSTLTSVNAGHYITLVDSNPAKTLAMSGYRPSNDPTDTYIGLDNGSVSLDKAQLAFGAPTAISNYIGNAGDGANWKERLTSKQKIFNVPVAINSGNTFTLGTGSALSQMKIFRTSIIPKTIVPAHGCLDVDGLADGVSAAEQVTGITPPSALGNLSLNAYAKAANTVTLHFCNPSTSGAEVPSGAYSFLAVH